jgi:hypothetical protein
MYHKFPTPRRRAKPKFDSIIPPEKEQDEPIGLIQGQTPDSKEEWWISKGLDRIGIPYQYQYPVNGGRKRGGYMIDFVVYTVPLATMIEPVGNHWHTGELGADDKKRQADVENLMQDICRVPLVNLWIPDMLDEETVYQQLLRQLT